MNPLEGFMTIFIFIFITILCGIENIPLNIPYTQSEYGEYSMEYH